MKKLYRFMVPFTLFWSAIVLMFDVVCARSLVGQWRSRSFVAAPATILGSKVEVHSSDGATYDASVRYEYRVAGRRYESSRVRYGQMGESNGRWAHETVADNPVGATRTIWHDPADPAESVLQRGIGGQELFLTLFLTPFNAVMLGLWAGLGTAVRRVPPAGGVRISTGTDEIRVWYSALGPGYAALAAGGAMAFILIFIIGFSRGFAPQVGPVAAAWGAVALAGGAGFFGSRRRNRHAAPDFVVSAADGTVKLASAKPPLIIPLEQVHGVAVRERTKATSDGPSTALVVALLTAPPGAAETTEHDLGTWVLPARAEAFAAWLRETLSLPRSD